MVNTLIFKERGPGLDSPPPTLHLFIVPWMMAFFYSHNKCRHNTLQLYFFVWNISIFMSLNTAPICIKGLKRVFFLVDNRFLFYNDFSEIAYNKTIDFSRNDWKLFSVCDMSFKFVKNEESELLNVSLCMRAVLRLSRPFSWLTISPPNILGKN